MELKTTKRFVLKAHSEACDKWKKEIEKEFPKAFEVKLEVGKWYIGSIDFHSFINIKKLTWMGHYNRIEYFGCCHDSWTWEEDTIYNVEHERSLRLATPEEIETMLWQEAEKRGIDKDTKIEKCLDYEEDDSETNCGDWNCIYRKQDDSLWNINGCVYKQGKFATPLDPNKELKQEIKKMEQELKKLKERIK